MGKSKAKKNTIRAVLPFWGLNLVILALGACLVLWAEKVTTAMSIVLGVTLLIFSAWYLMDYLLGEAENRIASKLISAVSLALFGGFFIWQQNFIKEFISIVVGIGLTISGLFAIRDALLIKKVYPGFHKKSLITAVICVICGALCVLGKLIVPDVMLQLLGIMMIIYSISHTCETIFTISANRQAHKQTKADKAIEAEVIETEEKRKK